MKILHMTDILRTGGKERQLVELLKGLTERGVINEVIIMDHEIHYKQILNLGIKLHHLIRKTKKDFRIYIKLYSICVAFKPDIIHTWDYMTTIYAVPIAKMLGIKLVNNSLRQGMPKIKMFSSVWMRGRIAFPFCNRIVANSYAGIVSFKLQNTKKALCIHNGFDLARISGVENAELLRASMNINGHKVVGMVASVSKNKDHKTFILAAKQLIDKGIKAVFLIIGDGELTKENMELRGKKYENQIIFLGNKTNVESYINLFDVGVLTSTNYGEGMSNSIMEYMALGKPCIASNVGGNPELIDNNQTGYLIDLYSPVQLAEKIEYLLNNPQKAATMGEKAKKKIETQFNLDLLTTKYLQLYSELTISNSLN